MFPIWMHMEEVPLIRLDSKLTEGFLVLSWLHFPIVLFPLFNTESRTTKCMFPYLPLLGQCRFGVFLPTSYLLLCRLSSRADETVG